MIYQKTTSLHWLNNGETGIPSLGSPWPVRNIWITLASEKKIHMFEDTA
jgi:hypothetical protein